MASKTIQTILNLKDNFSNTLRRTTENTKEFKRQTKEAQTALKDMKATAANGFKAIGVVAAAGGAAFAAVAKQALDYADGIQQTADVTGFTAEKVQELTYVGENLGVSFETISGANAKLVKSMDAARSATSPQAKAFKQLGINVLDSTGKLKDSKAVFTEALNKLHGMKNATERDAMAMKLFGKSAMELNPLIKAGGDEINRMTKEFSDSGAVLSGEQVAALDTFGDTIGSLGLMFKGLAAQLVVEFMPTLQSMMDKFKSIDFGAKIKQLKSLAIEGFEKLSTAIGWVRDNMNWLLPIMAGVAGAFVAFSTITKVVMLFNAFKAATEGVTLAQAFLNATMLANPFVQIALGIGAVIAIGVLLWRNWDTVKAKAIELWGVLTSTWTGIKTGVTAIVSEMAQGISNSINAIKGGFIAAFTAIGSVVGGVFKGIANTYISVFNFVFGMLNKIKVKVPDWIPAIGGKEFGFKLPVIPKFANGTQYFKGGIAQINERGGEIVNLPNGSQVIPADKSSKMLGGRPIQINLTIQGNVIGNEAFADSVGDHIWNKVQFALNKG